MKTLGSCQPWPFSGRGPVNLRKQRRTQIGQQNATWVKQWNQWNCAMRIGGQVSHVCRPRTACPVRNWFRIIQGNLAAMACRHGTRKNILSRPRNIRDMYNIEVCTSVPQHTLSFMQGTLQITSCVHLYNYIYTCMIIYVEHYIYIYICTHMS